MASVYKRQDLLGFLKQAAASAGSFATQTPPSSRLPTFVFGNTSADLDSIVSSIVWSYFATSAARQYVPIVNLPDVSSGSELRRLRPELMVALKHALATSKGVLGNDDADVEASILREILLTTKDLRQLLEQGELEAKRRLDVMLVDWNALPKLNSGRGIPGLSDVLEKHIDLSVVGCIDHHADEGFVPGDAEPRRIQTPIGSCTSLIVREIRDRALWHEPGEDHVHHKHPDAAANEAQAAKLALSAILIDTINMTEDNKVSETDIEEVVFLEDKIRFAISVAGFINWDRQRYYDQVAEAKESSVNNLTIQEVLGRDYKEWLEEIQDESGKSVRIGIINVGKPLLWLLSKSSAASSTILDEVLDFATTRKLDVAAIMTTFTDTQGNFNRELLLFTLNAEFVDKAELFESHGISVLGLKPWARATTAEVPEQITATEQDLLQSRKDSKVPFFRVWQQTELGKSRKQVAPLLRHAFSGQLREKL